MFSDFVRALLKRELTIFCDFLYAIFDNNKKETLMKEMLGKRQGDDGKHIGVYKVVSVLVMIAVSILEIALLSGVFHSFIILKLLSILILIPVTFLFVFAIIRCKIAFWEADYPEFPTEHPFFAAVPADFEEQYKILCFPAGHFVAVQPTNEGFSVIQPFWSGKSSSMFLLRSLSRNNQYYFFKVRAEVSQKWTGTLLGRKDCLSAFSTQLGAIELNYTIENFRVANLDKFCDVDKLPYGIDDAKQILTNPSYLPSEKGSSSVVNDYIRQRLQKCVSKCLGVEYDQVLRRIGNDFQHQIGNTAQTLNAAIDRLAHEVAIYTTQVRNNIYGEFLKEFHAENDEYLQFGIYEFKISRSSMQIKSTFTEHLGQLQNNVQDFLAQGNLPIQNIAQYLKGFNGLDPTLLALLQPVFDSIMNPVQQETISSFDLERMEKLQANRNQKLLLDTSGVAEHAFEECNHDYAETCERLNAFLQYTEQDSNGLTHDVNLNEYTAWHRQLPTIREKTE